MAGGFGFNTSASDGFGLGAMFTGVFDNIVTTKDETQQNANQLLLGQYSIDAQLTAQRERNTVITTVAIIIAFVFLLALLFR